MSEPQGVKPDSGSQGAAPTSAPQPAPAAESYLTRERLEKYRDKLFELVLLFVPQALIGAWLARISKPFVEQPWHAVLFMASFFILTWIAWQRASRRSSLQVRGWMLVFLVVYLSLFSCVASLRVLDWKHESVIVARSQLPRHWLMPASWGDWRYWFIARGERVVDPVVITVKPPASPDAGRIEVANLIQFAVNQGARGIAFDFHFSDSASAFDSILCGLVKSAGIPVFAGVRIKPGAVAGGLHAEPYNSAIESCWPQELRGHLHGYRDADGRVRNVVTRISGRDYVALSERVARAVNSKLDTTRRALIQFVETGSPIATVASDQLARLQPGELTGRFLFVGEDSPQETFSTPFGDRLGVQIHATAAANLISNHWIQRTQWWSSMLLIFAACYLIIALVVEGFSPRSLVLTASGVSVFLLLTAALAMRLSLFWLDVVYPLVAVWLLLALLLYRRRLTRRPVASSRSA
jgi:hypothetical protein